jgi:hypothetical protein
MDTLENVESLLLLLVHVYIHKFILKVYRWTTFENGIFKSCEVNQIIHILSTVLTTLVE